jgi:predicted transcriptional regulator
MKLTETRIRILEAIKEMNEKPTTIRAIARHIGKDVGNINRSIHKLIDADIVRVDRPIMRGIKAEAVFSINYKAVNESIEKYQQILDSINL